MVSWMLLVFLLKYKLHPEPSSFNFFFSYGMAVINFINIIKGKEKFHRSIPPAGARQENRAVLPETIVSVRKS